MSTCGKELKIATNRCLILNSVRDWSGIYFSNGYLIQLTKQFVIDLMRYFDKNNNEKIDK
jgi:hypothetical protein